MPEFNAPTEKDTSCPNCSFAVLVQIPKTGIIKMLLALLRLEMYVCPHCTTYFLRKTVTISDINRAN